MKHFILFAVICAVSISLNAQDTFRYDTIRSEKNVPQQYHYDSQKFSYDTIRHSRQNQSNQPARQSSRQSTNKKTAKPQKTASPTETNASSFNRNKLFFGGNIGLQFGDYTLVDISPQIGYSFNKYFSAGTGIRFTYANADYWNYEATRTYAGLSLFAHVYPIQNIILSFQPGVDYLWATNKYNNGEKYSDNRTVPSFVIGGGLRIPMGNSALIMMIQYDVVQDDYSPFGDSIFYSFGYVFSF